MSNYNFQALGPQEFEHLAQSLVAAAFGPSTTPTGSGRDGGVDATVVFTPESAAPTGGTWNGPCVVQAKFKEHPEGTAKDSSWLLRHARQILLGSEPCKGRDGVRPKYFLLVTNVRLGSDPDTGMRQKLLDIYAQHRRKFGGRAYMELDVIDHDRLRVLLDNAHDVRRKYRALITPGDAFSAVLDSLGLETNLESALHAYLCGQLRADQTLALRESGGAAQDNEAIRLSDVFFDLPCLVGRGERAGDPLADPWSKRSAAALAASHCLDLCSYLHRPALAVRLPDRILVVGGPGQGKTTVGRFLCQVYRSLLLSRRPPTSLSPAVRAAVTAVAEQAHESGLHLPGWVRYPFRVVLTAFADALARDQCRSLLGYLADEVSRRGDYRVPPASLRAWFADQPVLVVLDGLDEVPAAANRAQVLEALENFHTETASLDADVVVVATSRPQGYAGELDDYQLVTLRELGTDQALAYARRLVSLRHQDDPERTGVVLDRMERAAHDPSTARLMLSPLQVTILSLLMERMQHAPKDRYTLFNEYYRTIYEREMDKPTEYSDLLSSRRAEVDRVHWLAGLALHMRSALRGGTESQLSEDELRLLASRHLRSEGHTEQAARTLSGQIARAATDRLVFLVPLSGGIGFELRSLQEFMAAQAVCDGPDAAVAARLEQLTWSAHWRNVVLFVAAKTFVDTRGLRPQVLGLTLGTPSAHPLLEAAGKVVRYGPRLAVDILRDGACRSSPATSRQLMDAACGLMDLPWSDAHRKLVEVIDQGLYAPWRNAASQNIRGRRPAAAAGTWVTLALAVEQPVRQSSGLLTSLASTLPWDERLWLAELGLSRGLPPLVEQLAEALAGVHPVDLAAARPPSYWLGLSARLRARKTWRSGVEWLVGVASLVHVGPDPGASRASAVRLGPHVFPLVSATRAMQGLATRARDYPDLAPGWAWPALLVEYLNEESPVYLSLALRRLASSPLTARDTGALVRQLPSCLALCLAVSNGADDMARLADARVDTFLPVDQAYDGDGGQLLTVPEDFAALSVDDLRTPDGRQRLLVALLPLFCHVPDLPDPSDATVDGYVDWLRGLDTSGRPLLAEAIDRLSMGRELMVPSHAEPHGPQEPHTSPEGGNTDRGQQELLELLAAGELPSPHELNAAETETLLRWVEARSGLPEGVAGWEEFAFPDFVESLARQA